jgi:hypothetical protein
MSTVAGEKPKRARAGKRASRTADASAPETPPVSKRQFVDIDPWAMLLDQLMEMPEERTPATRERSKRK